MPNPRLCDEVWHKKPNDDIKLPIEHSSLGLRPKGRSEAERPKLVGSFVLSRASLFMDIKTKNELEVAQSLIDTYIDLHSSLKKLGVLRTNKSVISDYGEWVASKFLNLELAENNVQAGYDAVDVKGKKYQIKARTSDKGEPAYHFRKIEPKEFNFAVFVDFTPQLELKMLAIVPYDTVKKYISKTKSSYRLYFTKEVAEDESVKYIKK